RGSSSGSIGLSATHPTVKGSAAGRYVVWCDTMRRRYDASCAPLLAALQGAQQQQLKEILRRCESATGGGVRNWPDGRTEGRLGGAWEVAVGYRLSVRPSDRPTPFTLNL